MSTRRAWGGAGAEYLLRTSGSPMSLFAKSDFGDDQYNRITGGLKIYFGRDPGKSLMERHRTDDPDNYTPKFPALKTQAQTALPQCTVDSDFIVTSPANGQCICPSGTLLAGSPPQPSGGSFTCLNPD